MAEKSLKVDLMYKKEDEWTQCFEVQNVKLPSVSYLGFSAETGELSDNFDLMSVETRNLYSPSGKGQGQGQPSQKDFSRNKYASTGQQKEGAGGWGWFLLKFVLFGLAVTGAYVGFTVYRARQRDRF